MRWIDVHRGQLELAGAVLFTLGFWSLFVAACYVVITL